MLVGEVEVQPGSPSLDKKGREAKRQVTARTKLKGSCGRRLVRRSKSRSVVKAGRIGSCES